MTSTYTKKGDDTIFVTIHGSHIICNTIKQIMANHIPTYAIERVIIYENDSVISSDILCQRLGLIPVKMDPKKNNNMEIKFELDITANDTIVDVYTNDLTHNNLPTLLLEQNIQLSILKKNQRIKIEAFANVSTGDDHIKYSPVCAPTFSSIGPNKCILTIETKGAKDPLSIYNDSIDVLYDQLSSIVMTI